MEPPARTYHDVRERRQAGGRAEIEQWRAAGGRLYERLESGREAPVVRVAAAERGLEMRGGTIRPLRPAELTLWLREVRMVPANFVAHAAEMGVTTTTEAGVERMEADHERLVLERNAATGHARRVTDLRAKVTIEFEQPRDTQGRSVPRIEIRRSADREIWRDRIVSVEFDAPVPPEVLRLWEGLEQKR